MKNISKLDKNNCTGCRMCEQICPVKAINMIENEEGFIEPQIDKQKCIDCGLCFKRCPQLNRKNIKTQPDVYAVRLKSLKEQMESSSGGAFVAIAKAVLKQEGVVFGCAFSKDLIAEHIKVDNLEDLKKLKGSKYVQSNVKDTYKEVEKYLKNDKKVLYSGSPCQIAGLQAYLSKEYKNLLTVDIICHGVPSPKLFERYKDWLEKKYKAKLKWYDFRNKEKKLLGYNAKMVFEKNKKILVKYKNASLDPYYQSFLNAYTYRECCYNCLYANENRISDFTIADFWGIEQAHPEFNDKRGISLLIVNTQKAKEIFKEEIKNNLDYVKSTMNKASEKNMNLKKPTKRPQQRDYAYQNIDNQNFKKYAKTSLEFRKQLKKILLDIIPEKLKIQVKDLLRSYR